MARSGMDRQGKQRFGMDGSGMAQIVMAWLGSPRYGPFRGPIRDMVCSGYGSAGFGLVE